MRRIITALHSLQEGRAVTTLGSLPGPDEAMRHDELVDLARQIHQASIDNQMIENTPKRHPATPGYFEFPDPPSFEESCDFDPVPFALAAGNRGESNHDNQ